MEHEEQLVGAESKFPNGSTKQLILGPSRKYAGLDPPKASLFEVLGSKAYLMELLERLADASQKHIFL